MSITIAEIRSKLKDDYGFGEEELKQKKGILSKKLKQLEAERVLLSSAEEDKDVPSDTVLTQEEPSMDSADWADYVMSKFQSDELEQGNPTCDGLRRVTEALVGPIVSRKIGVVQAPNKDNFGTATVTCSVSVLNNIPQHILYNMTVVEEDAADVNKFNTQEPYHLHATATAATRAEARALRKILRLKKVIAVEELAGETSEDFIDAWKPSDPVQEEQINLLDIVCQRCDVNVLEYISSGERVYSSVFELDRSKAQSMIQHVNKIQQGKVDRPSGVGAYIAGWRD